MIARAGPECDNKEVLDGGQLFMQHLSFDLVIYLESVEAVLSASEHGSVIRTWDMVWRLFPKAASLVVDMALC